MKKIFAITLLCVFTLSAFSQSKDQIVLTKKKYYLNDKVLSSKELKTVLKSDPESAAMLKKAQTNSTVGTVLIGVGTITCLVGVVIEFASTTKEASDVSNGNSTTNNSSGLVLATVIGGAGLVIAGVPFFIIGNKQMKKSITIYNSKHTTGYNYNLKLDLGLTQNGVGLTCKF